MSQRESPNASSSSLLTTPAQIQSRPVFARHCPNPERQRYAGRQCDQGKRDEQIAACHEGRRAPLFDLKRDAQQTDRLPLIEFFLATLDGGDEVTPAFP